MKNRMIIIASIIVCVAAGACFFTNRGTKNIENSMAEIVKAEDGGQQSGEEKWCIKEVAGDCVVLKKEKTTSGEDANAGIFNSTDAALKGLERDGDDWDVAYSDEEYAILANRELNADGSAASEDDETWSKNVLKANCDIFLECHTAGGNLEQSDLVTKLQAIKSECEETAK